MTAVVYATPGELYLSPTNATTGGTLISGVEEQDISMTVSPDVRVFRTGIGVNAGFTMLRGRQEPARLLIPLRQQDTTGLKILLSHLTTSGGSIRPTGGTATAELRALPSFALILRPKSTSEKYLYSPYWQVSPEQELAVLHSEDGAQLEGNILVLVATQAVGVSTPPWLWDTAANINTAYGL